MDYARIVLAFIAVLSASPAQAGESPSVVVVEGISLPTHLDGFHARARDAIVKSVESAGWRVVDGGQSACRDASCAAELARGAGATGAVIADGQYRTGGYDLRVQIWNGQEMIVDQATCEDCTGPEFVTRLGVLVARLLEVQNKKLAASQPALAASPVMKTPPVPTAPATAATQPRRSYVAPLGWVLVAGGVAAAAGGGYLLWADGQLENCVDTSASTRNCSRERQTHGGLPLAIGGASIAAIGGALLIYHHVSAPAELAIRMGPGAVALSGTF